MTSSGRIIILISLLNLCGTGYLTYQHYQIHNHFMALLDILSAEEIEEIKEIKEIKEAFIAINTPDELKNMLENNKKPSVLFFYMNGCGWCTKMKPVLEEIAQNKNFNGIDFYSINGQSTQAPSLVKELLDQQIQGYPFIIITNEGKFIDKQVGFTQKEQFEQKIQQILKK